MALMRWQAPYDLASFQNEMNQLFDEFFQQTPSRRGLLEGVWNPATDISETEEEVVVRFELPGVSPDDVKISITDNVLTVKGEKKEETEENKRNYHRNECCYGAFQRSFTLSSDVNADEIKATFKHGVLKIVLPKAEEAKPKDVKIEVS